MALDVDPAADDDAFDAQRERVSNPMLRLFRAYGWPNARYFGVGVIASIAARVLDLLPPVLLGLAIDAVFRDTRPYSLPLVPQSWLPAEEAGQFELTVVLIAAGFLGGAAFHWGRNWGWNAFAQRIQHAIRTDTYDRMQRLNVGFFADRQTGELMSVLSNDVNRLERFLNDGLNSFFRLAVMVVAIAAILVSMNPQLALISLLPVPLIAGFTVLFVRTIQPKYAEVRSSVGRLNARLENNLGGIRVIKTSTAEEHESERVADASGDYFDANWDAIETRITFFPGLRLLSGLGFVVTFLVGGLWVFQGSAPWILSGTLSEGQFVVFILLTQRFIWPMAQFGQIINMYQRARASSERVFGLMDEPASIPEEPNAPPLDVTDGRVAFEDVSFAYPHTETDGDGPDRPDRADDGTADGSPGDTDSNDLDTPDPVLHDVTVTVPGGDTLGVVGPTGAGKSTLLKLVLRMYDPDAGAIRIDGQDLRDVSITSLRRNVGYVGQDPFLFHGTVRENLAYGTFDADDDAVEAAARAAEAHRFITNLADGYETMVGERGVKLSGGQRQRIAVARAILKDPPILLLDEATSDVDTETELLIQRSLADLAADRTTIAVAHRLSTIKDADEIVVIEDGRVAERGTHDDLLDAGGLYARLWRVQAGDIDGIPEAFVDRVAERRARRTEADGGVDPATE